MSAIEDNDSSYWPELENRLFTDEGDSRLNANWPRADEHVRIILGYERAVNLLFEQIVTFKAGSLDLIQFPFIFLRRHEIELRLKELIQFGRALCNESSEAPKSHDLCKLWTEVRSLNQRLLCLDGAVGDDTMTERIQEFQQWDSRATASRYPVVEPNVNCGDSINLIAFHKTSNEMALFLDCILESWKELESNENFGSERQRRGTA